MTRLKKWKTLLTSTFQDFSLASLSLSLVAALSAHNPGSVMNDTAFHTAITNIQKTSKLSEKRNKTTYGISPSAFSTCLSDTTCTVGTWALSKVAVFLISISLRGSLRWNGFSTHLWYCLVSHTAGY